MGQGNTKPDPGAFRSFAFPDGCARGFAVFLSQLTGTNEQINQRVNYLPPVCRHNGGSALLKCEDVRQLYVCF